MSIKADVRELQSIRLELRRLTQERKELKEKEAKVEARIRDFLKAKDQPGLRDGDFSLIIEEKEVAGPKRPKERQEDSIAVLERYGVHSPEKLLEELMQARKGEVVVKEKLKVSKPRKNKN